MQYLQLHHTSIIILQVLQMANNAIIYVSTVISLEIPLETRVNKFGKKNFSLDHSQSDDYIRTCTCN